AYGPAMPCEQSTTRRPSSARSGIGRSSLVLRGSAGWLVFLLRPHVLQVADDLWHLLVELVDGPNVAGLGGDLRRDLRQAVEADQRARDHEVAAVDVRSGIGAEPGDERPDRLRRVRLAERLERLEALHAGGAAALRRLAHFIADDEPGAGARPDGVRAHAVAAHVARDRAREADDPL